VVSAVQFLQDPSVSSSSIENRIQFLRSKNLTQEEIDAALARSNGSPPPSMSPAAPYQNGPSGPPQQYYNPYQQNAWQPPPPPPPRRDWRDWFIVATVVGGVSYGLYSLGKRYVYPLVAPPTPERLEQDKKSIEEQFDRAFTLVEQLSKDTEALKEAEQQRTERLDTTLSDLEAVMAELKSANRRREDDAQRIRDEVQALKDAIPKAMNNQKELADTRLREINTELTSLKTLVSQRMSSGSSSPGNHLRPTSGNAAPAVSRSGSAAGENAGEGGSTSGGDLPKASAQSSTARGSGLSNGSSGAKASIPAWQMAMSSQNGGAASSANGSDNGQVEAGSSRS